MENASKALIIAGAILISIILISIGVMVVNSGQALVDEAGAQMSEQELQSYNRKYSQYIGNQRGSTVRSIIQDVMANNSNRTDLIITISFMGSEYADNTTIKDLPAKVKPSTQYSVKVELSDAGRVNKLIIAEPETD